MQDHEALKVPLGKVSVLMVGAQGTGLEFFPIGDVEDAEEVYAELLRVDDARDEVAALHDEADALSASTGEAGGYDGPEQVGLGDGALDDVFVGAQGSGVEEFVGVEGVATEQAGLVGREVWVYGGAQETGADVVGEAKMSKEGVTEGGLSHARNSGQQDYEGLGGFGRGEEG